MVLLALVAFIDSVDRGILPGVLNNVQDDLGFSDTQAGLLGTAFVLAGFVVTLPSGYIADRYRRTHVIAIVLVTWGAISALNSAVRSYWQFLAVRAMLGFGETVDNPASQTLLADYYPPETRGRAFAFQRAAPVVGVAIGTVLGGVVAELLSWRWAFLLVGVPGSVLAVAVWRLPEPRRGESDNLAVSDEGSVDVDGGAEAPQLLPAVPPVVPTPRERAVVMLRDARTCMNVPTLRSLMFGTAIASGALSGLGFWAAAFFARHANLGDGESAGAAGALIALGAVSGTIAGGFIIDRIRHRYDGAAMLFAGTAQSIGAALLMISFLPVPLGFRIPVQIVAVAAVVAGLPALATMIAEVVAPTLRGAAYALTTFLSSIVSALSPLIIGVLADQFPITVDGETKGHLATAFLIVTPLVFVGAGVVLRGRRHVVADTAAAAAAAAPA